MDNLTQYKNELEYYENRITTIQTDFITTKRNYVNELIKLRTQRRRILSNIKHLEQGDLFND